MKIDLLQTQVDQEGENMYGCCCCYHCCCSFQMVYCDVGDCNPANVLSGFPISIFCSACGEDVFADDEECICGIYRNETKLDVSKVQLIKILVCGRGYSGF